MRFLRRDIFVLLSCRPSDGRGMKKLSLLQSPTLPASGLLYVECGGKPKTHQRSLSDASVLKPGLSESSIRVEPDSIFSHKRVGSSGLPKNRLGDLTSGHGFDNGCMCFEPVFDSLRPTEGGCVCGVS